MNMEILFDWNLHVHSFLLQLLRPDFNFNSVVKHECNISVPVCDALLQHDRPDSVIPVIKHQRIPPSGYEGIIGNIVKYSEVTQLPVISSFFGLCLR